MKKRITFNIDIDVTDTEETKEIEMHKMTIDIDADLFRKFKVQCIERGDVMSDIIRDYIKEITK